MEHHFDFVVEGFNTEEAKYLYEEILHIVYRTPQARCAGGVQPISEEVHYISERFEIGVSPGRYKIYDSTKGIGYIASFTLLEDALEYVKLLEAKD